MAPQVFFPRVVRATSDTSIAGMGRVVPAARKRTWSVEVSEGVCVDALYGERADAEAHCSELAIAGLRSSLAGMDEMNRHFAERMLALMESDHAARFGAPCFEQGAAESAPEAVAEPVAAEPAPVVEPVAAEPAELLSPEELGCIAALEAGPAAHVSLAHGAYAPVALPFPELEPDPDALSPNNGVLPQSKRQALLADYATDESGYIVSPGKFEGNPLYAVYFWEAFLNGLADEDDGDTLTFVVDDSDRAEFPELENVTSVLLWEDGCGFVHCDCNTVND